jgi:hypothetical protein
LTGLDQPNIPTATKANGTKNIKVEKSGVKKHSTDPIRKKDGVRETIHEDSKDKIQHQNPECLLEEVVVCSAASSDRTPVNKTKHSHIKPPKATSSRARKAKDHGQEKTKRIRDNISNKAEESKQTGNKRKLETITIPKTKQKRNQPELSQENFKKP